jgi:hypothetical protein
VRYIIIISTILLFGSTKAQFDQQKFEKIFQEEVGNKKNSTRENHSAVYQHTTPQAVPSWFINLPVCESTEVYSIGISDPEMDSTLGYETALYRAQIMANVFYNGTTQLLCDFFFNEANNTSDIVYEHFSRINSNSYFDNNYEVIESYTNSYAETIVLIKYALKDKITSDNFNKIRLELYKNEIEASNRTEYESIYELSVYSDTENTDTLMFYQITQFGKKHDVVSKTNKTIKQVPIYSLKYMGLPSADSASVHYYSHGLWKEYFKSLTLHIISIARLKLENIQHISDAYQKDNFEKLTRGISVNKMRFALTGISGFNNELKVAMQELPIIE